MSTGDEAGAVRRVELSRDFDYPMSRHAVRHYKAGKTYDRVLELHAQAIVAAGAGRILDEPQKLLPDPASIGRPQTAEASDAAPARSPARRRDRA